MKSFLKYTLATIVGFLIVNILLFFIVIGFIGAVASFSEKPVEVKDNSILKIQLNESLTDRSSSNPMANFDFFSMTPKKSIGLNKILKSINNAATDGRIKGIYLDLTDIQGNFGAVASVEEIRTALLNFKKSGKFIFSYSNLGYSQKSYFLASVADSVFVNPEAPLMLTGLAGDVVFYKATLEKLGIQPEIFKVGKFKSAVEPFIATEISEANREQMQTYLNSTWNTLIGGIAEGRRMTTDKINEVTNNFKVYPTEESKELGFFDGCIYEDEMLAKLKNQVGAKEKEKLNFAEITEYQNVLMPSKYSKDKIAVIYATGEIGMKQSETAIGPELAATIRKVREDENIKAVVLRVNSPGGSALTSDIIWREVMLTSKVKPVIASMGNVAASGGYYISCAADTIVADRMTLTGSIGIFGMFFNGEKLIKDKIGLTNSVVKTNEHSDFGGSYPLPFPIGSRGFTEYERNVMQNYINRGYDTFLSRVMEGRHMSRERLDSIAQGRVWTGENALTIGLVDVLGGLEDAIVLAKEKAGLTEYNLMEYPKEKSPFEEILGTFTTGVKTSMLKSELGAFYGEYEQIKDIVNTQGVLARVPFNLEIK